jgi:chromosome partitioning protein
MGKIISICNQKGGTGKTTTTVNLSTALAELNKKVLIVDVDPQGNATSGVGVNKNKLESSVYDVLLQRCTIQNATIANIYRNLDIIPCNINLTGAEIELVGALSRETRLKKALEPIKNKYDFIIIDSPPSLGLLTLNALVASDGIIIPIQCEFYALEGVSQLMNTLNLIKESLNSKISIEGVLMTMADFRTNLTAEVINEIKIYFKEKVYKSIIPRNIRLSEAPSHGKPITIYDQSSIGAQRYRELAREVLDKDLMTGNLSNMENLGDLDGVIQSSEKNGNGVPEKF